MHKSCAEHCCHTVQHGTPDKQQPIILHATSVLSQHQHKPQSIRTASKQRMLQCHHRHQHHSSLGLCSYHTIIDISITAALVCSCTTQTYRIRLQDRSQAAAPPPQVAAEYIANLVCSNLHSKLLLQPPCKFFLPHSPMDGLDTSTMWHDICSVLASRLHSAALPNYFL